MAGLQLTNVNYQKAANRTAHHTSDYSNQSLILRRAQEFKISLTFNRPVRSDETIGFTVDTGPSPSLNNKTKVKFSVSTSAKRGEWGAVKGSGTGSSMDITITSPASAIVGFYKFSLQMTSGGRTSSSQLEDVVLLFNPWASDDEVFMSNDTERKEYVLNENGIIFWEANGSYRDWGYGQFEESILEICFQILNRSLEYRRNAVADVTKRNDPKYVGRVMSAMVNNNDRDNGVLVGRWSGSYADGVLPTRWNTSTSILLQWLRSGPVKYAQCWVYAGVLCTVLRCLGIPTRVITNFESAHDTNGNLLIDQVFDESAKPLNTIGDSVWNFHVWNESWFTRPDLGSKYNGWQILDATPQEPSGGIFRLGPTSLTAIKEGDVDLDYDGPFVFAEMNADKVQWIQYEDGSLERVYSDSRSIGRNTSTKAVGSRSRVLVTENYKYPEGSTKEREIFDKARSKVRGSGGSGGSGGFGGSGGRMMALSAMAAEAPPPPKPEFSGKFTIEGTPEVGQDIHVTLSLKSESSSNIKMKVNINATAITYTRQAVHEVLTETQDVELKPGEAKTISLTITYAQYEGHLTEHNLIQTNAVCEDDKGGKLLVETDITLKNPPILVKVTGQAKVNQPISVEIVFTNPLDQDVKDCELVLEGAGLLKEPLKVSVKSLKRNQRSRVIIELDPYKMGDRQLLVNFTSDKFCDMKGAKDVTVAAA